jgi:hypothetical protein
VTPTYEVRGGRRLVSPQQLRSRRSRAGQRGSPCSIADRTRPGALTMTSSQAL